MTDGFVQDSVLKRDAFSETVLGHDGARPERKLVMRRLDGLSRIGGFVGYRLVNTFAAGGLWAHRSDSLTFASWGTFRGDNGKDNAANAAWGWDDGNDGSDLQRGLLATDPAKLVAAYFGNEGSFALSYLRNGYV